jgi:hypothetical protein
MVILGVKLEDNIVTGLGKRYLSTCRAALKDAVWYYHREIFPRHFFQSNRSRYKHEKRSEYYLKRIKLRKGVATGKYVDEILTGVSRRRMLAFATVRSSDGGNSVILRVQAPRYFTNPYVGSFRDDKGNLKTIQRQPDKVAEVQQVNSEDQQKITDFTSNRVMERFQALKSRGRRS